MGEIADDCYDRALSELEEMETGDLWEFEYRMSQCFQVRERQAQRRRIEQARSARDLFNNLDDTPPF